jgi:hypothetical protein
MADLQRCPLEGVARDLLEIQSLIESGELNEQGFDWDMRNVLQRKLDEVIIKLRDPLSQETFGLGCCVPAAFMNAFDQILLGLDGAKPYPKVPEAGTRKKNANSRILKVKFHVSSKDLSTNLVSSQPNVSHVLLCFECSLCIVF